VEHPVKRYSMGTPTPAWINHISELGYRAGAGMYPAFRDKKFLESYKVTETPFNLAYNTDKPFWEWMETVDDGVRAQSFARAMQLDGVIDFSQYPWHKLEPGSILVDVGGGVGAVAASILPRAPNISKAIVQDRPPIVEGAKAFWDAKDPQFLASGKVVLQAHSFFEPQPVKGAHVYVLRFIIHDWSDVDSITILRHLHDAAGSHSRLLVMDAVVNHACHDLGGIDEEAVEGAYPPPYPYPLPANGGRVVEYLLNIDLHMLCHLNGQERTHLHLKEIANQAGWRPTGVYEVGVVGWKITELVKI